MKFNLLLLLIAIAHLAFSQSAETIQVKYNFKHIKDLETPKEPILIDYLLSIKDQRSRFLPYFIYENNSRNTATPPVTIPKGDIITASGMPGVIVTNLGGLLIEEINKNLSSEKVAIEARAFSKTFSTYERTAKLNWNIQPEIKQVLTYNCQKATVTFAGRKYIAWFAKSLPISDGPWKFSGLPGLILEIEDEAKEVSFKAVEIFRNKDNDVNSLINNTNSIKLSNKAYADLKKKFEENPAEVALGFYSKTSFGIKNIQNPANNNIRKIVTYNPIEK